jgi:hypothetical protein
VDRVHDAQRLLDIGNQVLRVLSIDSRWLPSHGLLANPNCASSAMIPASVVMLTSMVMDDS